MHIRNLAQKIEIDYVIKASWHLPVHKHTHYEMQFIIKGSGQHIIEDQSYPYQKGDVFLLPPQETHFFIFNEKTAICVIKFNEAFFSTFLMDNDFSRLFSRFSSPNRKVQVAGKNRSQIIGLMELIIAVHRKDAVSGFILKGALALVLAFCQRMRKPIHRSRRTTKSKRS
ncbi:MAG: AraC family ligand binding domain-containing protein [Bacteroidota bacterium]|nr:AraC family ligand binding domain-containing protein [Bacteroidota bacterium]